MSDPDENTTNQQDPQKGESTPATQNPPANEADKGTQQDTLPDKFKGKTLEDVARSYVELEKNLGKITKEKDSELAQWKELGKVIAQDPQLYEALKKKAYGEKAEEKKPDDTRLALENQIVSQFETNFGIDRLQGEKRTELVGRIGKELGEMLDPTGTRTLKDVLSEVPLNRLPIYLEKAYRLSTVDDQAERARSEAILRARMNDAATIGSIPSGSVNPDTVQLTDAEKTAAKKMGISEKDYLESKKEGLKQGG